MRYGRKAVSAIAAFVQSLILATLLVISHGTGGVGATGSITASGTITDQNGLGVQDVSVMATSPGGSTVVYGPTKSDSAGFYQLSIAVAGTYDLHFNPPNGAGWNPIVQSNVVVISDQTINVQLVPTVLSHTFSGIFRDASGKPMPDVTLNFAVGAGGVFSTTDAGGHFSFTMPAGQYGLHGSFSHKPGYPDFVQFSGPSIDLTSGDVTHDLQIPLQTATLTILVKDIHGNPIQGVSVSGGASSVSAPLFNGASPSQVAGSASSVQTDVNGSASQLFFKDTPFYAGNICAYFGAPLNAVCTTDAVTLNGNVTVTIIKPDVHTLSGTLLNADGTPIPNAVLSIPHGAGGVFSTTDANGHFSLTNSPGAYLLSASLHGLSGYPDSVNIIGPVFDLTNNDVTQTLQIPLRTTTLTVVAKDSAGNPVQNVSVQGNPDYQAAPLFAGDTTSRAAGTGVFPITNSAGSSSATFFNGATFPAGRICVNFGIPLNNVCNTDVVILSGATTVTITKPEVHTLSGVFRDADGQPMSGVTLALPHEAGAVFSTTDANGHFAITNSPGVYPLSASFYDRSGYPQTVHITGPSFDLTDNDISQDLQFSLQSVTLTITAKNSAGNPVVNATASADTSTPLTVSLFNGDTLSTARGFTALPATDSSGSTSGRFFNGATFPAGRICVNFGSAVGNICNTSTVVLHGNTSVLLQQLPAVPSAPTGLTASSPTQTPNLSWNAVSGVTSYNIYRDGTKIGSTASTTYADSNAAEGSHNYYVTAVNLGGESAQSNVVTVLVDRTNPNMTYSISPVPNGNQWNNGDVTVTFNCSDTLSGIDTCSPPVTVSTEGANQTVTGMATDNAGNTSTASVTVNIDKTAPAISYSVIPAANSNGWNNGDVTVAFTCNDSLSGIASCPQPVTVSAEGANQVVAGTVTDNAGNTASVTATISLDKTVPTVAMPTWSANPLQQGQSTTLSTIVSDGLSGVASVQYSIDGGVPQPMAFDTTSGTWQATLGANLTAGTYNVTLTATDNAGNTSAGVTDILAVYTTANGYVTGHAKLQPSASDKLPIALDTSNHPANLVLGFTNVTAPASGSFDMSYVVKKNQNEFSLASTGIDWVVVQDSTHASILGHGDLTTYVNGVKTVTQNVSVRFDIVLGANGAPDQVTVQIFNPGLNPNTDAPTYIISDVDSTSGSNLMIHP